MMDKARRVFDEPNDYQIKSVKINVIYYHANLVLMALMTPLCTKKG